MRKLEDWVEALEFEIRAVAKEVFAIGAMIPCIEGEDFLAEGISEILTTISHKLENMSQGQMYGYRACY